MKSRKLKGTVIGLPQVLAIILFIVVIVIALDLITPYIGLRGPGITERIIYKLKELFMMPIPDIVVMYHFEGGPAGKWVEDSSGHHNGGTLNEEATLWITEAFIGSGSIHFTNTTGNFTVYKEDEDPKKRLPRYFDSIKGELTISFWIKLEEPSDKPIIETNNFKVEIENDEIKVGIWLETGWKYWGSGGTTLKRDAWTHVGIIYSNITGKGETFINGRIVGKLGEDIKSTFKPQEGAFTVGNFKGYMDELRIYNRALSSGEIVMHFQGLY